MPLSYQLICRATEGQKVNAVMRVEAPILVGDQQLDEAGIDIAGGRRQPPASLLGGIGA